MENNHKKGVSIRNMTTSMMGPHLMIESHTHSPHIFVLLTNFQDHLQLPRPAVVNPAVRPLEGRYLAEYGFPSTHVLAVTMMAGVVFMYTWRQDYAGRGEYPVLFAFSITCTIVLLTMFSRVYAGVHSVPDILGGVTISICSLWVFFRYGHSFPLKLAWPYLACAGAEMISWTAFCLCVEWVLAHWRLLSWPF